MRIFLILLLLCNFLSGNRAFATSAHDVQEKAGQTVDSAADFSKEKKDAFIKEMNENISALDKKIDELKSQTTHSTKQSISDLENQKKSLETNLEKMKHTSGKAMLHIRDGLSKAWYDIKTSLDQN